MTKYFLDVNECEQGLASCADRCVNTVGSYSCACPLGYTGSIDDCVGMNTQTLLSFQALQHNHGIFFIVSRP